MPMTSDADTVPEAKVTAALLLPGQVAAQSCTLCGDGNSPPNPGVSVSDSTLDEYGAETCGELAALPEIRALNFGDCDQLRALVGVGECACVPSEDVCTVCPDRSFVPNPDIILDDRGTNCRDLAVVAALDSNFGGADACADYHLAGFACGCPLPDFDSPCSLCQGGDASPAPLATTSDGNTTCIALEQVLPYLQAESGICTLSQIDGAFFCGCPPPIEGICATCPDGSLVDPDIVLEESVDFNVTCLDVAYFYNSLGDPDDDCSFFYLETASRCGCPPAVPGETSCDLCPDGDVSDPNIVVEELDPEQTCGEVDALIVNTPPQSDACRFLQSAAGAPCGCPIADVGCTICPDGSSLPDPSISIGDDLTCRDVQVTANADASDECDLFHLNAFTCQCPAIEGGCTLCQDGSAPTLPDVEIGFQYTCQDLLNDAAFIAADSELCESLQFTGSTSCGCTPLNGPCKVCADGSDVPDPGFVIDDEGTTCGAIQSLLSFEEEGACTDAEYAGALCGCPPLANGGCSACFGGASFTGVPQGGDGDNTELCMMQDELLGAISGDSDICAAFQGAAFFECGCPDLPPIRENSLCTLCPNGEAPEFLDFSFPGSTATCEDYYVAATLLTEEVDCFDLQETVAALCGCPGVSLPNPCTACEGGSPIPNPSLELIPGMTCEDFIPIVLLEGQDPDACTSYQATVGVYCGCDNPLASEGACRICRGTNLLSDATRLLGDGTNVTCGQVEFETYEGDCGAAQSLYFDTCCDTEAPTLTPSMTPSVAPSELPSAEPSSAPSTEPSAVSSTEPSIASNASPVAEPATEPPSSASSGALAMVDDGPFLVVLGLAFMSTLVCGL